MYNNICESSQPDYQHTVKSYCFVQVFLSEYSTEIGKAIKMNDEP